MQGGATLAYRWLSTILGLPLFLSAFLNYYNRFGVDEEQRFVYVMDHILGELTGIPSFSILETFLCLVAGFGCLAIWVPLGRLPNLFGLLMGASYFGFLAQYAYYGGLPDQLAGFIAVGLIYLVAFGWGVWGQEALGSRSVPRVLVGAGVVGLGLLGISIRMALRAPEMEQTFSDYRRYMQLTGMESPEELGATEADE
ncbi:MAG: hypothetical protein AAGA48_36140 [Myxococcota bacterium]